MGRLFAEGHLRRVPGCPFVACPALHLQQKHSRIKAPPTHTHTHKHTHRATKSTRPQPKKNNAPHTLATKGQPHLRTHSKNTRRPALAANKRPQQQQKKKTRVLAVACFSRCRCSPSSLTHFLPAASTHSKKDPQQKTH